MLAGYSTQKDVFPMRYTWHRYVECVEVTQTCGLTYNSGFQSACRDLLKSFHRACHGVYRLKPKLSRSSLPRYILPNRKTWFANMWGKTSLIPVFSRSSFHLEWTHMPHFSSSIVLEVLGDTCGAVCPAVVFMEMGKGMKVTQNEHRRWTANYEWEEGWRGWRRGRGRLVRHTPAMCPPRPLLPISCSLALHLLHPTAFFLLFWVI